MKAVIYSRFSTDRQDPRSIDDQVRECRTYAERKGYEIVGQYADEASSGASLARVGLQQLLAEAKNTRGKAFQAVLVDDLSRLSRELGNTWQVIYHNLLPLGVAVVDRMSGMASNDRGARITFGAKALVSDMFLEMVREQTHRGLEGRALAGFWTGGKVFGYETVAEENPADPMRPRKVPRIKTAEADVLVRIFRMYDEGNAMMRIAHQLNKEGCPSPSGGTRHRVTRPGWSLASLHHVLHNDRYTGILKWNTHEWTKNATTGKRMRRERPKSEWVQKVVPELRIVPEELWDSVAAKLKDHKDRGIGARGPRADERTYLLSGLLRCGNCGGAMGIRGSRVSGGVRKAAYGCTRNYNRGEAMCDNTMGIPEEKANAGIIGAIQDALRDPALVARITGSFERDTIATPAPTTNLSKEIQDAEARLANLANALASRPSSSTLLERLDKEEAQLRTLRDRLGQSPKTKQAKAGTPDPKVVKDYLKDLAKTLGKDPRNANLLLKKHVRRIVLTPKTEGPLRTYHAEGAFNLSPTLWISGRSSSGGKI